jgi:16S rRNA (guanine527-N7)-methyltransferase
MQKFANDSETTIGLHLTIAQVSMFETYERELMSWNDKFNLTAIREPEGIRTKHFLDSLTCLNEMNHPIQGKLIDVGTGAGFPGIPLKIVSPHLHVTLVESVGKKAEFCKHIVKLLALNDVEILTTRVEEVGHLADHREKYDWAVARAVSSLPTLAEYLLPLLRIGGMMLAQKGESAHAETQMSENAIRRFGGKLIRITKVTLPGVVDERFIVVIQKTSACPALYPRQVGIPAKKPLI